ncbi:hypothetical protein [Nitrosomonas communis]|uniref:hypothetical protein n=1 Tax=Nitrosomonas communis TaxID=44574 RepID=UPI0011602436|nr:hypothetical protein [Nitrosomonas communis]
MKQNADPVDKFYSEPKAYIVMFRGLVSALGAIIIGATIFGQIRAGRFPAYWDLRFLFYFHSVAISFLSSSRIWDARFSLFGSTLKASKHPTQSAYQHSWLGVT